MIGLMMLMPGGDPPGGDPPGAWPRTEPAWFRTTPIETGRGQLAIGGWLRAPTAERSVLFEVGSIGIPNACRLPPNACRLPPPPPPALGALGIAIDAAIEAVIEDMSLSLLLEVGIAAPGSDSNILSSCTEAREAGSMSRHIRSMLVTSGFVAVSTASALCCESVWHKSS